MRISALICPDISEYVLECFSEPAGLKTGMNTKRGLCRDDLQDIQEWDAEVP